MFYKLAKSLPNLWLFQATTLSVINLCLNKRFFDSCECSWILEDEKTSDDRSTDVSGFPAFFLFGFRVGKFTKKMLKSRISAGKDKYCRNNLL